MVTVPAQRLLGPLALGDIHGHRQDRVDLAAGVAQGNLVDQMMLDLTILVCKRFLVELRACGYVFDVNDTGLAVRIRNHMLVVLNFAL